MGRLPALPLAAVRPPPLHLRRQDGRKVSPDPSAVDAEKFTGLGWTMQRSLAVSEIDRWCHIPTRTCAADRGTTISELTRCR